LTLHNQHSPNTRVVVCGTGFGRVYLSAFADPSGPLRLTGILGRGSARTKACAQRYHVPLLTHVDEVAEHADIACVVVPNGVGGGAGATLAQQLLERGVHVLHEHPIHETELSACLKTARKHGVYYRLNTFYPDLAPVRRFLIAARYLQTRQKLLFIEASCAIHVAFDLLDMLGQVVGGLQPWELCEPAPVPASEHKLGPRPFRTLEGMLRGIPLTLRVLNQLDPHDPDNHTHLLHRVTVGLSGGTLMLASTHGPLLWSPALPAPRGEDGELDFDAEAQEIVRVPSLQAVGPAQAPSYREVYGELWPAAVRRTLQDMTAAIQAGHNCMQLGQYHLTLSRIWQTLVSRLGYPDLVRRQTPVAITAAGLDTAVEHAWGTA